MLHAVKPDVTSGLAIIQSDNLNSNGSRSLPLQNPAPPAIRAQVDRILQSPAFLDSPRLSALLRYLVEQKLAGRAESIKEYTVGLEAFGRPPSFDPKTDSIVRSSARNLRARLSEYYQNPGARDRLIIQIPKGGYAPEFHSAKPPAGRWLWPALAAVVLIVTAWSALGWRGSHSDLHPVVAVIDIANASNRDDDAWLSTALAEMITEDLAANEGLQTIPTEQVDQLRRDLAPAPIRQSIPQHGTEIQNRLGAHYAVLASFHVTGSPNPAVQVDTRLTRLRDGQVVFETSDRESQSQLYNLSAQIASKIRRAFGVPRADRSARTGPNRDSMRLYAQAVKCKESDPLAARALLTSSASADPSNFMARSLLAEVDFTLGMDAQAKIEGQAALALAPELPPVERLALEARCQGAMRDYPAAVRSYRKLWSISPEVAEYGFNLADFEEKAGSDGASLQTLQALRKTHLSLVDEARADFAEASLHAKAGEFQKALKLVRQCQAKARQVNARYLYARARLREGGLLMNLVASGVLPALEEGIAICREQGYRTCQFNGLRQEGNFFVISQPRRAMQLYDQAATVARQVGNRSALVEVLRGMAYIAARQMLDNEAEQRYQEIGRLIQDEGLAEKAGVRVDLPGLLIAEGRIDDAAALLLQIHLAPAQSLYWNMYMADIESYRAAYDSAARRATAQVEFARKTEDHFALAQALAHLFWIHCRQGNLRQAETEARDVRRLRPFDPLGSYLLAELAAARKQWNQAAAFAGEAAQLLRNGGKDRATETAIAVVTAEAFTQTGQPAKALNILDEIGPGLERSRRAPLKIRARLCRLRARALLGEGPASAQLRDLSMSSAGGR